jgi:hypothetical protein
MGIVNLVATNFGGQGFFGASIVFGWSRKHKHFLRISHAKLFSSFCAINRCHIQVTSTAPFVSHVICKFQTLFSHVQIELTNFLEVLDCEITNSLGIVLVPGSLLNYLVQNCV